MNFIKKLKDFRYTGKMLVIPCMLVVFLVASTCVTLIASAKREVTITDGENVIIAQTAKHTVAEVLAEQNVTLRDKDMVSADLNASVIENGNIIITRAVDVKIDNVGEELWIRTVPVSVGELLSQNNINVDENDEVLADEVTVDKNQIIADNMTIHIAKIDYTTYTEDEVIGYNYEETSSADIAKGESEIVTEGKNGLAKVTYQVTIKNGEAVSTQAVAKEVLAEPVNKVVANGTKIVSAPVAKLASRSGNSGGNSGTKVTSGNLAGARMIQCRGTAYDGSYETLGKYNPRTCMGETPYVGIVAVDPRIIPLGSKLYIETADGSYVYGYCKAGDTGVSGYHVDLFMGSRSEALSFGSRTVNVYILD